MLSEVQLQAAYLIASGRLSNLKIAEHCEVSERTINTWKADKEFSAEVERVLAACREAIEKRGIALKHNRLAALNGLQRRSVAAMKERAKLTVASLRRASQRLREQADRTLAADPAETWRIDAAADLRGKAEDLLAAIPMVKTGMYRVELKTLHVGEKSYEIVHEFFYDHQLVDEMRELMQQASIEMGDWKTKVEHAGKDGGPIENSLTVRFVKPTDPEA